MPGALEYLFGSQPPSSVNATLATDNGLPAWYQEYIRGIAAQGTAIAGANANAPIPAQSVAGFNPDQLQAFEDVRQNQGAWQPHLQAATDAAQSIQPTANNLVQRGQNAVAGPAQTWNNDAATRYMSPYTTQVIENIQRLGLRNFQENIMPGVNDQMIGSGQFGSTRNADILGRAARDVNADITGQVANALNSGYTNAQTMFTNDANRTQQQQQMQGSAALQGAGLTTAAGQAATGALSSLGTQTAGLSLNDAQALGAVGQQQQALTQEGLNADYTNATAANNYDWSQLNNLSSLVRGIQLPTTGVTAQNAPLPGAGFGAGPLAQVGGALSTLNTRRV